MRKERGPFGGIYTALLVLHLFMGISAAGGGIGALMDPSGAAMGISTDVLKRGPFEDFLIPGLFLLLVNGIGNLAAAAAAWRRYRLQAYPSGSLGGIMMAWIVIQVYMMQAVNFLHVIYFFFGFAAALLGFLLAMKQRLFPLNLLLDRLKR